MTPERLQEIRERAREATPGPWRERCGWLKHYVRSPQSDLWVSLQELDPGDGHETNAHNDAQFIAHARQDIPMLLNYIEQLQADLEVIGCVVKRP